MLKFASADLRRLLTIDEERRSFGEETYMGEDEAREMVRHQEALWALIQRLRAESNAQRDAAEKPVDSDPADF